MEQNISDFSLILVSTLAGRATPSFKEVVYRRQGTAEPDDIDEASLIREAARGLLSESDWQP